MRIAISIRVPHLREIRNNRVPHLRDGLIVAKVGGAAILLPEAR